METLTGMDSAGALLWPPAPDRPRSETSTISRHKSLQVAVLRLTAGGPVEINHGNHTVHGDLGFGFSLFLVVVSVLFGLQVSVIFIHG